MTDSTDKLQRKKRLAIVGCGSSGLISLKIAVEKLPDWEIVCFEKSDSVKGCWGNPYPGFVSTSTKYTTQFACFPLYDASVQDGGSNKKDEFFCDGEYGEYLEQFAGRFELIDFVRFHCSVEKVCKTEAGLWQINFRYESEDVSETEAFDSVILCTGVAQTARAIPKSIPQLSPATINPKDGFGQIRNQRIVVIGGGESAVSFADRLAKPELNNEVFLSLRSGIRVSPRYHPIRGVPSDFLRNRLMLSVHPDIRNWIGQRFVAARILYQEWFERLFPAKSSDKKALIHRSKEWSFKLTKAAKDNLFNMFHNKSDEFLDAVGEERIKIIGSPINDTFTEFADFESKNVLHIEPDAVVPAIGFESRFGKLVEPLVNLKEFYLGCCHVEQDGLYLVGFARPIIGNIPTISEMQAHLVVRWIAGERTVPSDIKHLQSQHIEAAEQLFPTINLNAAYPVEMIPYCDDLAKRCGLNAESSSHSMFKRWKRQLIPASTMHYFSDSKQLDLPDDTAPVFMPGILVALILLVKPVDWIYRLFRR